MNVTVSVSLNEGDNLAKEPGEIAEELLGVLGGDPEKDIVSVHVMAPAQIGTAGAVVPPAPEANEAAPTPEGNGAS